jgi:glycosyltransferase involved in cell wall biosynthesis
MKENHTVDVIIPAYNGLPYLKETVESVLSQSHKDLVLYIIDDGSPDNGATKKYAQSLKDGRVRYERKENGGQSTARNYGIRISNSPYVAFVDADDIWHKDKLKKQLELFDRNPEIGMVYGLCKLIDAQNNIFNEVVWQKRGNLFSYLLRGNKISGSASMVLVRREVFEAIGLFHEDFLIGEDWEMWLRIARHYQIDYVPEFIASLRVLENGMQRNYGKMAKGLDYMLPVMVKDFHLNLWERAILGKTCLKEACFLFYNGGDKPAARRIFVKSFAYNPFAFFTLNYHVWYLYLRILLGNEIIRKTRRRFSANYRTRELDSIAEQSSTIKNPTVSVVLPVYNGQEFICRAIDSVLAQSFKDFELLVIDDGSTDKTPLLLKAYTDPRMSVITQTKNQGLVAALQKGTELARGKFIARHDADDISAPLRLQKQVELFHKYHNLVLVGTNATVINVKGSETGKIAMPITDSALRWAMFSFNPFIHGSVMYLGSALKAAGGYDRTAYPAEDYELWMRLMKKGEVMNIAEPLYYFFSNEHGISQTQNDRQTQQVIAVRRKIFKHSTSILRSPWALRKAMAESSYRLQFATSARLALRTSVIHVRLINVLFISLNILVALPGSLRKGEHD